VIFIYKNWWYSLVWLQVTRFTAHIFCKMFYGIGINQLKNILIIVLTQHTFMVLNGSIHIPRLMSSMMNSCHYWYIKAHCLSTQVLVVVNADNSILAHSYLLNVSTLGWYCVDFHFGAFHILRDGPRQANLHSLQKGLKRWGWTL